MRPLKLSDLNLCNRISSPSKNVQQNVKFAKNFGTKCSIDLQELFAFQLTTKFTSLYLNYYDKQTNFVETIPVLIRNAFEVNEARVLSIV